MVLNIDEMQVVFGELTDWILRNPSPEEEATFNEWRYHIFVFLIPFLSLLFRKKLTLCNRRSNDVMNTKSDSHEILELLRHIQQSMLFMSYKHNSWFFCFQEEILFEVAGVEFFGSACFGTVPSSE